VPHVGRPGSRARSAPSSSPSRCARRSASPFAVVRQATGAAACARFTDTTLAGLSRRRQPREASRQQAVRQSEICRLVLVLREAGRALKANRAELHAIVNHLTPGLTTRQGSARSAPPRPSCRSPTPVAAATTPRSPNSLGQPDRGLQRPDHPPPT
jgi:hypothetical protein